MLFRITLQQLKISVDFGTDGLLCALGSLSASSSLCFTPTLFLSRVLLIKERLSGGMSFCSLTSCFRKKPHIHKSIMSKRSAPQDELMPETVFLFKCSFASVLFGGLPAALF